MAGDEVDGVAGGTGGALGAGGAAGGAPSAGGAAGTAAEGLARWPFWRANAARWPIRRVWPAGDDAAALVEVAREGSSMLVGLGDPARLAGVVAGVLADGGLPPGVGHTMLTRGTWDNLAQPARERLALVPTRSWLWLTCSRPPARQPGEERVAPVDGADRLGRVQAVLERAYPERGTRSDDADRHWWGWTGADGELAGVGGAWVPEPGSDGWVHVSSVAVLPSHRRRGVGAALTAALTRWGLSHGPVVHLGMWADNDDARRVYERLGYVVGHEVENLAPAF